MRRRLMVYVWYPTRRAEGAASGVYLPGAKQIDEAGSTNRLVQSAFWRQIVSGAVTSHVRTGEPLAASPRRLPVVLFSHGDSASTFAYTTAIEDLVSHGVVVAAVEHPFSSTAIVYGDGRIVQFADRRPTTERPANLPYFEGVGLAMNDVRRRNEIQADDLLFVIDRLQALDRDEPSSPFYGRLDLDRVAAVGHSLGGMTAVRACQRDRRVKACANLDGGTADGAFLRYPDARPLSQTFLYVEATPPLTFTDEQLAQRGVTRAAWTENSQAVAAATEAQLREGTGGSYKVVLRAPGLVHMSFCDTLFVAADPVAQSRALHNLMLTVSVTRAFVQKTLLGEARTLLDSPGTPEVSVLSYDGSGRPNR
jgi:pimeloyl-ACP methyl ester carboxylesterase